MQAHYSLRPLTLDAAAKAWPLVRSVDDAVSLSQWQQFVKRSHDSAEAAGVMAVEREGYIRGMFVWRLESDMANRRILQIDLFTISDALLRHSATEALLDGLQALAHKLDAHSIKTSLAVDSEVVGAFESRGFARQALCLHQRVKTKERG